MSTILTSPSLEKELQTYQNLGMQTNASPAPVPIPIPIPIPVVAGSRMLIWKQDPSVTDPGIRLTYVPTLVLDGPRDSRVTTTLTGITPVHANTNRDFIYTPGTPEFDCAHAFAIVRETLTMYQRSRGGAPVPWAWNVNGNTDPIVVLPRAGVTANAFYSRSAKSLNFFYFTPAQATPFGAHRIAVPRPNLSNDPLPVRLARVDPSSTRSRSAASLTRVGDG